MTEKEDIKMKTPASAASSKRDRYGEQKSVTDTKYFARLKQAVTRELKKVKATDEGLSMRDLIGAIDWARHYELNLVIEELQGDGVLDQIEVTPQIRRFRPRPSESAKK